MTQSDVTVVVVPRDHFSDTRESLESILKAIPADVPLVYVDGGSPEPTARYLRQRAAGRGFDLVRTDHYLSPNTARNMGATRVTTRYLVFVDNDVIVAPDWLAPLVACAETTGAAVVGPLNFEGRPLLTTVHFAGGETRIETAGEAGAPRRRLIDRIYKTRIPETWAETDVAEFHCMLVRTDTFRQVGGLDEKLLSTRENLDFCMMVREAGGKVFLEPRSRITYLAPDPMHLSDVPYFALRWSDAWDRSSFRHLRDKWQLDEDAYFQRQYANLGWRRRGLMMNRGLLRWIPSWRLRSLVERASRPLERSVNRFVARRYSQRHGIELR
ncbi:MAG: glycosyltransferase [Burkholderiales bacterium]|nr:MAG: glycosyltransferase [Burkholderiales bacterium]